MGAVKQYCTYVVAQVHIARAGHYIAEALRTTLVPSVLQSLVYRGSDVCVHPGEALDAVVKGSAP